MSLLYVGVGDGIISRRQHYEVLISMEKDVDRHSGLGVDETFTGVKSVERHRGVECKYGVCVLGDGIVRSSVGTGP